MSFNTKINDLNIYDEFKISVVATRGMFDMPSRLGSTEVDWYGENGVEAKVNEEDIFFKQRKISLDCHLFANDTLDFEYNLGRFKDLLYSGKVDLITEYGTGHFVMLKENVPVIFDTENRNNAKFTIVFHELKWFRAAPIEITDYPNTDTYSIGGHTFASMGMIITESSGYFDFTGIKSDKETKYKREGDKRLARLARNIRLKVNVEADSYLDLEKKFGFIHEILRTPELKKLTLKNITQTYEVYCKDGIRVNDIKISDDKIHAWFTLNLREPKPRTESIMLAYLIDVDGNYIIDINNNYIVCYVDREIYQKEPTFIYTDSEPGDPIYIWTDEETNQESEDYNPNSEEVYLYLDSELNEEL